MDKVAGFIETIAVNLRWLFILSHHPKSGTGLYKPKQFVSESSSY